MAVRQVNVEALRRGGVVALKEDLFSLWVKTACCNLNSRQLRKLADITDKYGRSLILFSTRQIPIIPFVRLEDVPDIKAELAECDLELDRCGPRVRNLNVCYDDKVCSHAVTNCISLGERLEVFFGSPILHKVKIGVAGCKRDCIVSRVLTDISFIGVAGIQRFDVYVGGRLGVNPFIGLQMAESLAEEECVKFVQNYLEFLDREGEKGERIADIISRLGAEIVSQALNKDLRLKPDLTAVECRDKIKEKQVSKEIVRLKATCGEVNSEQLRKIADLSDKFGLGIVHFDVYGAPEIPGVEGSEVPQLRVEARGAGLELLGEGFDNLQTCFGGYCLEALVDTQSLLRRLEKRTDELGFNDLRVKVSASGCPNSCGIAHVSDIGFHGVAEPEIEAGSCTGCELCVSVCKRKAITMENGIAVLNTEKCRYCGQCIAVCPISAIIEKRKGFAVLVGGRGGASPRLGVKIAEFVSEGTALETAERCLSMAKKNGGSIADIVDKFGVERFKEVATPGAV